MGPARPDALNRATLRAPQGDPCYTVLGDYKFGGQRRFAERCRVQDSTGVVSPARERIIELVVWLVLSGLVSGRPLLLLVRYPDEMAEIFQKFYGEVLAGVLLLLFPILYQLTFGYLPLEQLRRRTRAVRVGYRLEATGFPDLTVERPASKDQTLNVSGTSTMTDVNAESNSPDGLLAAYAQSSRRISEGLYTRAGIYLMIGVLIAFSGLVFFYTQTAAVREIAPQGAQAPLGGAGQNTIKELSDQLARLAPRFGILFFIEFIAFFFLRQYRSAMDEFRYFEAIKRHREEVLCLARLVKEPSGQAIVAELVKTGSFFSTAGKLAAGESTELLESRKLTKDEMAVFEKIIETIAGVKK